MEQKLNELMEELHNMKRDMENELSSSISELKQEVNSA